MLHRSWRDRSPERRPAAIVWAPQAPTWLPLGQCLGLERLELLLVDRAAVEQRLRALDVARGAAVRRNLLDVVVELDLGDLRVVHAALGHVLPVGDQVDECADE